MTARVTIADVWRVPHRSPFLARIVALLLVVALTCLLPSKAQALQSTKGPSFVAAKADAKLVFAVLERGAELSPPVQPWKERPIWSPFAQIPSCPSQNRAACSFSFGWRASGIRRPAPLVGTVELRL